MDAIAEYELLNRGDSVLVALSGGPDSVALLHMLRRLSSKWRLTLHAVYINHNIRKRAAKQEEQFCRKLCDRLGVALTIVSKDIPALAKSARKSIEQAARDFRYETFDRLADESGCHRIAVGHHVDDRVETVLFRIIRGTGPTGLRGIPPKRGRIIRPLYALTKEEIYAYLKQNRLKYCTDQSNLGVDYDRNYIRNRLLVDIRKNLNPAVDRALLNLSEIAGEDDTFLSQYLHGRVKGLVRRTAGGKIELDLSKYNRYDKWFRRRLLRYCLAEISPPNQGPEKIVVDRLDDLCRLKGKGLTIPGGIQATLAGERVLLYRRGAGSYSERLTPGKVSRLTTLNVDIRMSVQRRTAVKPERRKQARTVWLDYDKIHQPLVIRNIRGGDRFRPLGLAGTKKVGDYLTDRKVHPVYRDEVPVVCDRKGIIWLVGFEISDRVKIDSSTREVLKIGYSRRKEL
ncbi:MAG: tRNA lysidine(34) synthetase TilS [Candidatus Zixiibacteriota bacterium]|nr:MAG: tRNA lysidine(34) synthetase TilS [candidate division Zixibacteria bacterium]